MGLAAVCFCACGKVSLIAFGTTTVEVTMKKISSRKMTSVIEAMLKASLTLVFRFSAMTSLVCRFV